MLKLFIQVMLITLLFALTSCTPVARNSTSYPNPSLETAPTSEEDINPSAISYAENMGVSLEEAQRRFRLQDAAGELQVKLRENEADTFAAIWIEHVPKFKIVVLFTDHAEQKIKPYLTDELASVVEARTVEESRVMLEESKNKIISALLELGIPVGSELNVYENRINIYVNETNRVQFDKALQDKQIDISDNVDVITVWNMGQTGQAANPPSLGDHFPQLINMPNAYYDLPPIEGKVVLENGCLRISAIKETWAGADNFLIIWDARFSTRREQGVVQITNSLTNEVLASVGDYAVVAGNKIDKETMPSELKEPIPDECSGPYWLIGEFIKKVERP